MQVGIEQLPDHTVMRVSPLLPQVERVYWSEVPMVVYHRPGPELDGMPHDSIKSGVAVLRSPAAELPQKINWAPEQASFTGWACARSPKVLAAINAIRQAARCILICWFIFLLGLGGPQIAFL